MNSASAVRRCSGAQVRPTWSGPMPVSAPRNRLQEQAHAGVQPGQRDVAALQPGVAGLQRATPDESAAQGGGLAQAPVPAQAQPQRMVAGQLACPGSPTKLEATERVAPHDMGLLLLVGGLQQGRAPQAVGAEAAHQQAIGLDPVEAALQVAMTLADPALQGAAVARLREDREVWPAPARPGSPRLQPAPGRRPASGFTQQAVGSAPHQRPGAQRPRQ